MPSLKQQLQKAQNQLQQGLRVEAAQCIDEILKRAPKNPEALWLLGVLRLETGHAHLAVAPLQQSIQSDPRNGKVLDTLGLAYLQLSRFDEAASVLEQAARLAHAPAIVFSRWGLALMNVGRIQESLIPLQKAVQLEGQNPSFHLNLGQALFHHHQLPSARDAFTQAIKLAPHLIEAYTQLSLSYREEGDFSSAALWLEKALPYSSVQTELWHELGLIWEMSLQGDKAKHCFTKALNINPRWVPSINGLARALAREGQPQLARLQYREALALDADSLDAHDGLAMSCLALGRFTEAIPHLRVLLQAEPQNLTALHALASALLEIGELIEAETRALQLIELAPEAVYAIRCLATLLFLRGADVEAIDRLEKGYEATQEPELLGFLAFQYRQICDWPRWQAAWSKLAPLVSTDATLGSPFWLLCEPISAAQQLQYTRAWALRRFGPVVTRQVSQSRPTPSTTVNSSDRIRIGYLSSDFQEHAAAYLIAEVIEQHDREQFEVFAYSYGPTDKSPMRTRLLSAFEHFVDISWETDDSAAERIRSDKIDILIELKGYTVGDRISIMARRPCDIQVTWLGYPGTLGVDFVDYLIADPHIIPLGEESSCSETVLRLPYCYQPNDRKKIIATALSRKAYGLPDTGFIFCCFNQTYKITPEIFAVWMRLLKRVVGSTLWLVDQNEITKKNLLACAQSHGVDIDRLVFAPRAPYAEHLARYTVAHLALDTHPYTSHTTASDALWCRCPMVGLEQGDLFAARVSASILMAAGFSELITHNLQDYETLAYEIATNPAKLASLRERLDESIAKAPLFNSKAFTMNLEALFKTVLPQKVQSTT